MDDAQDRRYFESSITKAIKTPQRERGELFSKTNGLDGEELDATFNALVAEMNRQLGKATTDDKNSVETDLKETDGGGKNDADERDDDGFLSLERQKERRKEERERRERTRQIWAAQQFRDPFPTEVVPEIIRRRIEYAERTLNAEPSGLFAAATAAASSAIGYAAQVKRSAFDGARLAESRVTTGARSADAILISAIFGVQPKPLANGFNGVFKLIPNSKTRSRWSLNGEALLEWTLKSL